MNEEYLIKDIREMGHFKDETFSGFKKREVYTTLFKSIETNKVENACYWITECIISGYTLDILEKLLIFSSKIIPGNEKKLYKLHNQLVKDGIEVISEETEFIHVSGHPNREDLKDMYQWVKPKCVIPVHGEHRHMIEHINFAKEMQVPHPVQVENGDIVKLYPGEAPEVYDKAPSGRLYLDGNVSVEEDSQSIKDRKNLSSNGYLEVTILITPKGNIHNNPVTTFRGLPIYEKDEFLYGLEDEIEKTTRSFKLGSRQQESNLIDALKIACRKFTKEKTGKRPYTNINLVRI